MKKCVSLLLAVFCALTLFSCTGKSPEFSSTESFRLTSLMRASYAVCDTVCTDVSDGYASLTVRTTYAGEAQSELRCRSDKAAVGDEYVIFLNEKKDSLRYETGEFSYIRLSVDNAVWNGTSYSRTGLFRLLSQYKNTIRFPLGTYFYEKRSDLLKSSSYIVIGRLLHDPSIEERNTYAEDGNVSRSKMTKCFISQVTAIASLAGDIKSGTTLQVIYAPESVSSMTDASTLSTVSLAARDIPDLSGGEYYVFFLNKTEGAEQDFYFPVNPIQGWVSLVNDELSAAEKNTLFEDCKQLKQLVSELNLHSSQGQQRDSKNDPIGE